MMGQRGTMAGLDEGARERVNATGGVVVRTGSHSAGKGQETGFAQVIDEKIGIGEGMVEIVHGDNASRRMGRGSYGSRYIAVGGWAMASIVDVARDGPARRLDLSPVLGRSNLVKSPMVAYADGSMGLPAYFEMGSTFGLLARFDEARRQVRCDHC